MYTTVALHNIQFFAYHGFYAQEQVLGNHFVVDVSVEFIPTAIDDDLQHTLNYEELYTIVQAQMLQPRKLLETVANAINNNIVAAYPFAQTVCTGITKLNPPLPGQVGSSFIQIKYTKPA